MTRTVNSIFVAVVDDDESQRRAFVRLLRAVGIRSVPFTSAEEFRADLNYPDFDCLVVDIQLPGMSGIELRNQLAAEGIVMPVIFVTAYDDPAAREQALVGPCLGYFRKTDSGNDILEAIRRTVASAPGS